MPERIARSEKALEPYTDADDANLRDLLADLMHWSQAQGAVLRGCTRNGTQPFQQRATSTSQPNESN